VDPRIGTEFAGHTVERVIGRGGVSVVYLAEHLRLGRKVALKVLAPHLAEDEDFRERFIRESRIAAALDHPNIVTIYDAGEVEDSLYISMRYVEGSDLARLLRAEGTLETSRMILILSQVASALDAAHAQGLVHRDVKPANVLVESVGSAIERAYLSDFGISKRTTTGSGLTRTGQFVGTVDYVAPEQITGEPIDGRTDVYSLGCVLFQCISGRVPFAGDTEVATIYQQLNQAAPSLDERVDVFAEADAVIAKAMAKAKEDRYPSCSALIEAARVALSSRTMATVVRSAPSEALPSVSAQTDTRVVETPQRRTGRRRGVWVSIAGGALATAVLAWILIANVGGSPEPTPPVSGGTAGRDASPTTTAPEPPERLQLTWVRLKEEAVPQTGDQVMSDVVAGPEGLVAVGHVQATSFDDDAAVWVSDDTSQWRPSSSDSLGGPEDQRMIAVAELDGQLMAGGRAGLEAAVWTSRDAGTSWVREDEGGLGPGVIRDFGMIGSTLVAVGAVGSPTEVLLQDAGVWTSRNGRRWSPVVDDDLVGVGGQHIWAVHGFEGRLIAVGFDYGTDGSYDAAIWTSEDGRDWSRLDPAMFEETGHQLIQAIVGGTRGLPLVAVGCADDLDRCDLAGQDSDAAVWTSDDGEEWAKVDLAGESLVGPGVQRMNAVSRRGDTFIAVGTHTGAAGDLDGAVWTSLDGLSWALQRQPSFKVVALGGADDQSIRALTPFHGKGLSLVAVGDSDDGIDQDDIVWGGL
jgi:serine/threonine-protein kinase